MPFPNFGLAQRYLHLPSLVHFITGPKFTGHNRRWRQKDNTWTLVHAFDGSAGNIEHRHDSNVRYWNPQWLKAAALVFTTLLFVAITVALLVLRYFSKKDDGIPLHTNNHFLWTYGPTVVLTVVVAIWRQIDFYTKALVPWDELHRGNASPSKSVLLDYKSPFQIVSLYKAVRNSHGTVAITILGFVMLKLITLASTGLLLPNLVALPTQRMDVAKVTKLDGALYDPLANQGLFDASIAYTAYAVMAKGLPYAAGTADNMVYEQLGLFQQSRTVNGTVTADVEALIPEYHCESAPVAVHLQPANVTDQHPEDTLELLFPECTLRNAGTGIPVYALNPQTFVCPDRQLSPLLQQIDCNTEATSTVPDNWQLLTLTDFRYQQNLTNSSELNLGDPVAATTWSTGVQRVTSIACRAGFSLEKVQLVYDVGKEPPTIHINRIHGGNNTRLGNFTGFDLGELVTSALMASADMFGNLADNGEALEYPNVLFKMMAAMSGGRYEDLFNETTMLAAAEKVFQQVAIQSVAKYLVQSDNSTRAANLLKEEERLQISNLSAWFMLSGCLVMAVFSMFLVFRRPVNVCRHNPEPASSTALLMANSSEFMEIMKSVGSARDTEFETRFKGLTFSRETQALADRDHIFSLTVSSSDLLETKGVHTNDMSRNEKPSWWSPLTIKKPVLAMTISLPLATIIVLETLQQVSDKRQGISAIQNSSDAAITIYTRFLPALVMLLVASLINALDFNIAVLAPFDALRSARGQHSTRSIPTSNLGHPPPLALWKSVRQRHWGTFLSGIAALVGSVLTIVVSGLYTIENTALSQPVSVNRLDQFNTSWTNSVKNDSSAAVVASLTESLGLEYPQFTYGELALPALRAATPTNNANGSNLALWIEIPVLRSDLECVKVPKEMTNISATYNSRIETASALISARVPLPPTCPFGGASGNSTNIEFTTSFSLHGNSSFVGRLLDLHVGPFDAVLESSSLELSPDKQADNPPGCPSLGFVYGFADADDQSKTSITTLMCYQNIDELQANVTFTWPELAIPTSHPPVVDESSATRLPSGPNGETAFQFRLQLHMDDEFSSFNQTTANTSTTAGSSSPLDNFFQGVLFGKEPLDPALMVGDEADVSLVYSGIRGLYRRYMAQAISSNMRVPMSSGAGTQSIDSQGVSSPVAGTLLDAQSEPRIVQNRTAKLILQIQLGLMSVLAALAVRCSKVHEILPFNPCCIAGVAALFAWSRMCDLDDPVGQEVMADGGQGLRDGRWRFRLGWWDIGHGVGEMRHRWYGIDATRIGDEG